MSSKLKSYLLLVTALILFGILAYLLKDVTRENPQKSGNLFDANYYNDKASDKRNREAPKEEVTFDRLQNGGSVMIKTKLGRNKPTKLY